MSRLKLKVKEFIESIIFINAYMFNIVIGYLTLSVYY